MHPWLVVAVIADITALVLVCTSIGSNYWTRANVQRKELQELHRGNETVETLLDTEPVFHSYHRGIFHVCFHDVSPGFVRRHHRRLSGVCTPEVAFQGGHVRREQELRGHLLRGQLGLSLLAASVLLSTLVIRRCLTS